MGITEQIVRFALDTREIPAPVRALGTDHVVDGVAVMLAGAFAAAEATGVSGAALLDAYTRRPHPHAARHRAGGEVQPAVPDGHRRARAAGRHRAVRGREGAGPRTRALMERVRVYVDPELEALGYNEMRMKVDLTLTDGRRLSGYAELARGHPKKPMSRDDLREKFMDCAQLVMPAAAAESALEHLRAIGQVDRVADLMPMLVGDAA